MNFIAKYPSCAAASKALGIDTSSIAKVCNRIPRYNTAGGFIFRYEKDLETKI